MMGTPSLPTPSPTERDTTTATSLYPSMATPPPATSSSRPDTTPRAAALFPTMPTTQTADVIAEKARATTIVAPLTVNVPESHWARAEDFAAWETEVLAGPLTASLPAARAFLTQHAPPELVQMLEQTGYGSNRYVIQFVADLAAKFHTDGAR